MPIIYDSNKIIPGPQVNFQKQYETTDDGKQVGTGWIIQVKGKISADHGSPNSSGVFWQVSGYPPDESIAADSRLASIRKKQEAIRKLFAVEGKLFEIQPYDGSSAIKFNPRVKKIEFPEGLWYNTCDYTITFEADIVYLGGQALGEDNTLNAYFVSKVNEDWKLEAADEIARTYRLVHTVSAVGKRFYNTTGALVQEAWQNAKDYVLNKVVIGIDTARMIAPGVLDLSTFVAYNYIRGQEVNETAGTFQVTETWLCFDPANTPDDTSVGAAIAAVEDFTTNTRINTGEDNRVTVSIDGTIAGLESRDNTTHGTPTATRWDNAVLKFNAIQATNIVTSKPYLVERCEVGSSGVALNPVPVSKQFTYNHVKGTINYHYEYDNRPPMTITSLGYLSETVSIVEHIPGQVFANIPVIGKATGPVLQDIGTIRERRRDITIELVFPGAVYASPPNAITVIAPNTNALLAKFNPNPPGQTPAPYPQVFTERDDVSWNYKNGRYTRNTTYVYQ